MRLVFTRISMALLLLQCLLAVILTMWAVTHVGMFGTIVCVLSAGFFAWLAYTNFREAHACANNWDNTWLESNSESN